METLFEKITKDKETLAKYLLDACDNPLYEVNEDMCDFCDIYDIENHDNSDNESKCNKESCLKAIIKGLDSKV